VGKSNLDDRHYNGNIFFKLQGNVLTLLPYVLATKISIPGKF